MEVAGDSNDVTQIHILTLIASKMIWLYSDCSTPVVRVLTFQIEHRMSIHAVNEQIEGTVLPIADVSSGTAEEVYDFSQT